MLLSELSKTNRSRESFFSTKLIIVVVIVPTAADEREKQSNTAMFNTTQPGSFVQPVEVAKNKICDVSGVTTITHLQGVFISREHVARQRTCATCRCFLPPVASCVVNYDCEPPKNVAVY